MTAEERAALEAEIAAQNRRDRAYYQACAMVHAMPSLKWTPKSFVLPPPRRYRLEIPPCEFQGGLVVECDVNELRGLGLGLERALRCVRADAEHLGLL